MKTKVNESVKKTMPEKVAVNVGRRIVLVGTYKGDQLTKWRGWYNYPISAEDKISEVDETKVNEPDTNVINEDIHRFKEEA